MLEYTFKNEGDYLEAWQYLMRIGCGFKYNRETNFISVDTNQDEFGDPTWIKQRLDSIAGY